MTLVALAVGVALAQTIPPGLHDLPIRDCLRPALDRSTLRLDYRFGDGGAPTSVSVTDDAGQVLPTVQACVSEIFLAQPPFGAAVANTTVGVPLQVGHPLHPPSMVPFLPVEQAGSVQLMFGLTEAEVAALTTLPDDGNPCTVVLGPNVELAVPGPLGNGAEVSATLLVTVADRDTKP